MQSSKLTKDAPAHPNNAPQPATDIPHEDVSKKQSEAQKKYPVPTQVKQGDTVTLTQVGACTHPMPVSACRHFVHEPASSKGARELMDAAVDIHEDCWHDGLGLQDHRVCGREFIMS